MSASVSQRASASQHEQEYIPGTRVIKNLVDRDIQHPFGTDNPGHLERAETLRVSRRLRELEHAQIPSTFTFSHMREIHKHLFQDVYAWAGEPRRVPMTKYSASHDNTTYADPTEMNACARMVN